jgi:hypothetical protein
MRKKIGGAKRQRFAFSRSRENTDRNAHRQDQEKLRVTARQSSSLFSTLQIVVILNNVAGKGIPDRTFTVSC